MTPEEMRAKAVDLEEERETRMNHADDLAVAAAVWGVGAEICDHLS